MDRIEKVLDEMNVYYNFSRSVDGEPCDAMVKFSTDAAGQDIVTEFDYDGTAEDYVKQFTKKAEDYDVDEEVETYVPMRGERGVPYHVRDIIDDCQEAKETLMQIAAKLNEAIHPEEKEKKYSMVSRIKTYLKCEGPFIFGEDDDFDHAILALIDNIVEYAMKLPDKEQLYYIAEMIPWVCTDELVPLFEED